MSIDTITDDDDDVNNNNISSDDEKKAQSPIPPPIIPTSTTTTTDNIAKEQEPILHFVESSLACIVKELDTTNGRDRILSLLQFAPSIIGPVLLSIGLSRSARQCLNLIPLVLQYRACTRLTALLSKYSPRALATVFTPPVRDASSGRILPTSFIPWFVSMLEWLCNVGYLHYEQLSVLSEANVFLRTSHRKAQYQQILSVLWFWSLSLRLMVLLAQGVKDTLYDYLMTRHFAPTGLSKRGGSVRLGTSTSISTGCCSSSSPRKVRQIYLLSLLKTLCYWVISQGLLTSTIRLVNAGGSLCFLSENGCVPFAKAFNVIMKSCIPSWAGRPVPQIMVGVLGVTASVCEFYL